MDVLNQFGDQIFKFRMRYFPPVSKKKAVKLVRRALASESTDITVLDTPPLNIRLYQPPKEPCWYLFAPWQDGMDGKAIRSSRLLLLSKRSGEILYDGSANDEG